MSPITNDIPIKDVPHKANSLRWSMSCLSVVCSAGLKLVFPFDQSDSLRPQVVESRQADFGLVKCVCNSEDAHSLAEAGEIRFIDSSCSPPGVAKNKGSLLAILTADHRVAIYGPSRDPVRDPWKFRHALLPQALARTGYEEGAYIESIASIKHLRFCSIAWTDAAFYTDSRWGEVFLITGQQSGEIHFHSVSESTQGLLHVLKCSDHAINRIHPILWSSDGWLSIILGDQSGAILLASCKVAETAGRLHFTEESNLMVLSAGLLPSNNMQTKLFEDTVLIASTYPGKLQILSYSITARSLQTAVYALPFFSAVSALCWSEISPSSIRLIILSHHGNTVVLVIDRVALTIQQDIDFAQILEDFMQDVRSTRALTAGGAPDDWQIKFYGAALSPDCLFVSLSYSIEPVRRIKYQIAAYSWSKLTTICMVSNPQDRLRRILETFFLNPYATSVSYVCGLHRRLSISVLDTIDTCELRAQVACDQHSHASLSTRLFNSRPLNRDRVALASGELRDVALSSSISRLSVAMVTEILNFGRDCTATLAPPGRNTLLRYADYAVLYLGTKKDLIEMARAVYSVVAVQGPSTGSVVSSFLENGFASKDEWPTRDSCPACTSPVPLEESLNSARCTQGHIWSRCSVTLALLDSTQCRSCLTCGRKAVLEESVDDDDEAQRTIVNACPICHYCAGTWYHKI